MADHVSSATRHQGRVTQWNSAKGFGFVEVERSRVFIHIRDFSDRRRDPEVGDMVSFLLGTDPHGRSCAKNIQPLITAAPAYYHAARKLSLGHFAFMFGLLVLPMLAVYRLKQPGLALWFAGWVAAASALCYLYYAWDKRRAKAADWRLPENMLHIWALLGGWPGGYLAQRKLRHKSAKLSFLLTFWAIVASHQYIAFDSILDWRMTRRAATVVQNWMEDGVTLIRDLVPANNPAPARTRPLVY